MAFLLVQLIVNVIVFRMASDRFISVYKKLAYLFYPVYLLHPIIQGVISNLIHWVRGSQDPPYGFATDITYLTRVEIYALFLVVIVVQYIFNNYLIQLIRNKEIYR